MKVHHNSNFMMIEMRNNILFLPSIFCVENTQSLHHASSKIFTFLSRNVLLAHSEFR